MMNPDSKELPRTRQALFVLYQNSNAKYYKFDVNQTITIKNLKKMIVAAANIGKNSFRLFHKGVEYTLEDDSSLLELFPDLQLIEFDTQLTISHDEEFESNIELKLGKYCDVHNFKYPYFYCYDCRKSICSICQNNEHKTHNYIEKYDYLQSSRNLVESIFHGVKSFLDGTSIEEKTIHSLRQKISSQIFPKLRDMLSKLEVKLLEVTDSYCENEKTSYSNMQQNVGLLKNHCTEGLDKLKSEISIEDMMLDEDIFLTFDRKFKEIASEKYRVFNDTKKFQELKGIQDGINSFVDNVYNELLQIMEKWLQVGTYNDLKARIEGNSVSLVSKEDIFTKLLSDVKRKTTSKLLVTPGRPSTNLDLPSAGTGKVLTFPSHSGKGKKSSGKMLPLKTETGQTSPGPRFDSKSKLLKN